MTSLRDIDLEDYIATELFIHDDLLAQAERGLTALNAMWKRDRKIDPFLLVWPQEHVIGDDGTAITHVLQAEMPEDKSEWSEWLVEIVLRTKPYGLLLVEQKDKEVTALFETRHGSRSWQFPFKKHGDLLVLGQPQRQDDVESIGLLWKPRLGDQPS